MARLTDEEFRAWCQRNKIELETAAYIQHIRTAEPERKVRVRASNVSGRYPSQKMGFSIQFESQHVELWGCYTMERDEDMLEFYDQPTHLEAEQEAQVLAALTAYPGVSVTDTTELLIQLRGNTQASKTARQMTRDVDPKRLAVWTLERFAGRLSEYVHEVYDQMDHPALGQSPRNAFEQGMLLAGPRVHRLIAYSEDFLMLTRPTTRVGTVKIHPSRGITVNGLHYWHDSMRSIQVAGQMVAVRYEPYDMGVVYAYIGGQWVECIADAYGQVHGRSEREWNLILDEWREQQRQHAQKRISIHALPPSLRARIEREARAGEFKMDKAKTQSEQGLQQLLRNQAPVPGMAPTPTPHANGASTSKPSSDAHRGTLRQTRVERAATRDFVGDQVQTRNSPKCAFSGVIPIESKHFLDSGIRLVECPDCARTRSLSPSKGVLRFPSHDKCKTRTPNTDQRWAMEQTSL